MDVDCPCGNTECGAEAIPERCPYYDLPTGTGHTTTCEERRGPAE